MDFQDNRKLVGARVAKIKRSVGRVPAVIKLKVGKV